MGVAEHGVKNQVKGAAKETEGKVNEVAGAVKGDLGQELKGKIEKNVGKAQGAFGRAETKTAAETDRAVAHSSHGRRDDK